MAASNLESGSTALEVFFFLAEGTFSLSLGDLAGDLPFSLGVASGRASADVSFSSTATLLSTTTEFLMGSSTGGVRLEFVRMGTKGGGLVPDLRGTSGRSVDLPLDADVVTVGGSDE